MRFLPLFVTFLLFGACATAPPRDDAPPQDTAAAPSYSSAVAQLFAAAGRADAPSIAEVRRALGEPDITRREGAGAAWTYRLNSCALLLLFTADARNEMRLAEVHASARTPGDAAPTLEQCASEASTRRS